MMSSFDQKFYLKTIKGIANRLEQNLPWQKAVGTYLVSEQRRNFNLQGRPQHWKPIIAQKFGGFKILLATGRLRSSIVWKPIDKWSLKVGTNLIYARTHQYGREFTLTKPLIVRVRRTKKWLILGKGKHKIPARPFIVFIKEFFNNVKKITLEWFLKGKT